MVGYWDVSDDVRCSIGIFYWISRLSGVDIPHDLSWSRAVLGRSKADFQPGKLVLSSPFLSIDVPWHVQKRSPWETP